MKHNDKFIIYIFLGIIFFVLACYPIKYVLISKGIINLDYNNFKEAEKKEGTSLFVKIDNKISTIKTSLTNRVTNYFPFYSKINYSYANFNYKLNSIFYDDLTYIKANNDNEYIYRGKDYYVLLSTLNNNILDKKFDNQVNFYKKLASKSNVYLYLPNRYEYTNFVDDKINIRTKNKYLEMIEALDIDNFKVSSLNTKNIQEYKKYFYLTDHHWNSYGAYKGYVDIMNMMDIKPLDLDIVKTDVKFMGSIAKSSALKDVYDNFTYIDFKGNYKVLVNGKENIKYKPKVIKSSNNIYYDYYVSYYNGMFGMVEFDYNNLEKDNLLIISDSYAWQIDEIIASHFNKTFVVNVRYDEFINGSLNYDKFILDNNITNVLILSETSASLFDMYDYNTARKILGE